MCFFLVELVEAAVTYGEVIVSEVVAAKVEAP